MLSCRDVTERVTDFTEGRMTLRARLAFRLHLAMCAVCRHYVAQMKAIAGVAARADVPAPASDVVDPLVRAFLERPPASTDEKR